MLFDHMAFRETCRVHNQDRLDAYFQILINPALNNDLCTLTNDTIKICIYQIYLHCKIVQNFPVLGKKRKEKRKLIPML